MRGVSVNAADMEPDDLFAGRPDNPLTLLTRQDLDPLSVDELEDRIERLEAEIARCRARLHKAHDHRTSAEALFKR